MATIKKVLIAHFQDPFVFEYDENENVISVSKEYGWYNEKRYSAPKIMRVGMYEKKFPSGKVEYRFRFEEGQTVGNADQGGVASIHAKAGVYAYARKDNRGNNSTFVYFDRNGVEMSEKEVYDRLLAVIKKPKTAPPPAPVPAPAPVAPAFELSAPVAPEPSATPAPAKKAPTPNPAERAEVMRASYAAAESFELGGDPLANLTGQTAFLF